MSSTPPPLSHHEIIELIGPFTRRGRVLDLAASDRLQRRLRFQPREVDGGELGVLHEQLELESRGTGTLVLTRTLAAAGTAGSGGGPQGPQGPLQATLTAMGNEAGRLLDAIDAVPAQRHFTRGAGLAIARSYAVPGFGVASGHDVVLNRAVVQLEGLLLTMAVSPVRGVSADLTLQAGPDLAAALPEDLLAVLGWDWSRLLRRHDGWAAKLRLRGAAARRTPRCEAALARAAAHLAQTLAEPPARFHERHLGARWGVVFRRGIPVLTPLVLLAGLAAMPPFEPGGSPGLAILMYHVPTLLIALSFTLQELPRFEIPPLPRRATAARWGGDSAAPDGTPDGAAASTAPLNVP